MQRTVALNVVACNEQEGLARLLTLCAPHVDEIVVVHDGPCSDGSIEAACKYDATVYVGKHYEHAAPHRRVALALTESDWVFTIDPDEVPEERLLSDLRELVNEPGVAGYTMRKVAYVDNEFLQDVAWFSLFRVLPSVQYSMLPHATHAPIGLAGSVIVPTNYVIMHCKSAAIHKVQRQRYVRVVRPLLERFGDIPKLKAHLERCLVMNPKIVAICKEKGVLL